jgi:formate dehydrogenase major subunit/formate dehydrogenase alpha subunit
VVPPGQAKEDTWIIAELSRRMGYEMSCSSPDGIFEELGSLWPALEGISYTRIESWGIQWPCPTKNHPGTEYLYKGGFPRGRVPFAPAAFEPSAEKTGSEYPFILSTGRNLFHYHFGSMTRRVSALESHAGEAYIEMHPDDVAKLNIQDGSRVKVSSPGGSIGLKVRSTDRVTPGVVFIPMHYGEAAVNILTSDVAVDTFSKTPGYKITAVRIEPAKEGE